MLTPGNKAHIKKLIKLRKYLLKTMQAHHLKIRFKKGVLKTYNKAYWEKLTKPDKQHIKPYKTSSKKRVKASGRV